MPLSPRRCLLLLPVLMLVVAASAPGASARRPARTPGPPVTVEPAGSVGPAAVAWPVSGDVVIGEVVTGGAAADDEWIELHGRGPAAASLDGLELLYVSAGGGSVSRRLAFGPTVVLPGTSLLLANAAGVHARLADLRWVGGLAASGGVVVLRVIGGDVVDALAWGTAANPFVEGTPGLAPPAGSALERLPEGTARNGRDTNDNRADTWIQPVPIPDGATAVGSAVGSAV
ncbi:MAG: lamin tail domain-containing protein, partial [Chloroflexota bacterium]